ncbi:MAG: T9SS C-terminal target domain-containing protein [Chitinophagaceae bacterium]|nr:MAG: T9SS C-terminal target domain-containing protein [Chitinophagaceae bacterium]
MKQIASFFFAMTVFLSPSFADCSGNRYAAEIFSDVNVTTDIEYGYNPNSETTLRLDFYEGMGDTETNRPLIIMIHGGTFITGSKSAADMVYMCENFAKRGYAAASINYSLGISGISETDLFVAVVKAVHDAKAAIRFFRKEAAENANPFGINPDKIFIGGYSAGAITAVQVAYLKDDSSPISSNLQTALDNQGGTLEGESGNAGYSSSVAGVFNISGGIHKLDWMEVGDVPIVSVHGDSDNTVPYGFGDVGVGGINLTTLHGGFDINEHAPTLDIRSALYTYGGGGHEAPIIADSLNTTFTFGADFLYDEVCVGTSVENFIHSSTSNITVYPNPSNGTFNLNFINTQESKTYELSLYNLEGRLLENKQINATDNTKLDFSNYNNGLYLLQLTDADGSTITKKLQIQ